MKSDFAKHLSELEAPTIEMKGHRQNLRRVLLASPHWNKKLSFLSNLTFFLKGGEKNMIYKRLSALGLAAVVVLAAMFMTNIRSSSPTAYAKELTQKSIQTVSQLSSEEKKALEGRVQADTESLLSKAQKAKDLEVLTYDQVKDMLPNESDADIITQRERDGVTNVRGPEKGLEEGKGPDKGLEMRVRGNPPPMHSPESTKGTKKHVRGNPPDDILAKLKRAKFLRFTSSEGGHVIIGLGEDNLPLIMIEGFDGPKGR